MNAVPFSARFSRFFRHILPGLAVAAVLVGGYGLFMQRVLPGIVQHEAVKYVEGHTGHHLSLDRPVINPWNLSIEVGHLRLTTPQGAPLLAFEDVFVDVSAESLFHRALVLDTIRVTAPEANLTALPHDRLNWSAFLEAFKSKDKTSTETPRLIVKDFTLARGHLTLIDQRTSAVKEAAVLPLGVHLINLTTLPGQRGQLVLTAKTDFDATIRWQSDITLKPLSLSGTVSTEGASLAKLPRLAPWPPHLLAPAGTASIRLSYRVHFDKRFDLSLDRISAHIDGVVLTAKADPTTAVRIGQIALSGGRFNLNSRHFSAESLTVDGGHVCLTRDKKGVLNLMRLAPPPSAAPSATPVKPSAPAVTWSIGRIGVTGFGVDVADKTTMLNLHLTNMALDVRGVSGDMAKPLGVRFSVDQAVGGHLSAEGTLVPATKTADFTIALDDLALIPVQPLLAKLTTLKIVGGTLSTHGHATFDGKRGAFTGGFALDNLRLLENKQTFLAWESLSTETLQASPEKLTIRELMLNGVDTRLLIAQDKTVNFTQILKPQKGAPKPATTTTATTAKPLPVRIGRIRIRGGQLEFADRSLAMPFGTHIHALNGTLVNVSTLRSGAPARLQIEGQIDEYGMARAAGRFSPFDPTKLLDIKVAFKNVEMTSLTPYSATFAGRRIDSGKLNLDLEYKIRDRQLAGDNRIVMDRITLGERVESPSAHNLPLDLAIAILEDSDGRIDLGLPVSGNMNDPKFSIRGIVWQAVVNVLTKIATSPFRALGIMGGSNDTFDGLAFEAGRSTLTPPEQEKLATFAAGLLKHPKLTVAVVGTWSTADRVALQDLQLRKTLAAKLGFSADGDPGLIAPDQHKVKPVLESLYAERFGRGALAALKEGFAKANPGAMAPSTQDKLVSALTGVLGTKPTLSADDITRLKGADLHVTLYGALRAGVVVPDTALAALANARADGVMAELLKAKAPPARVVRKGVAKVEAVDASVPLTLDLGTTAAGPD